MKLLKQNNPAVIGVLALIAIVSLGKTFLILRAGGTVNDLSVAPLSLPLAATAPPTLEVADLPLATGGRDPFFHPLVLRAARVNEAAGGGSAGGAKQENSALLKLQTTSAEAGKRAQEPGKSGAGGVGVQGGAPPAALQPSPSLSAPNAMVENRKSPTEITDASNCKLTAILRGRQVAALLLLPDGSSRRVRVGDVVLGARVASIGDREIVLTGASGVWTVPLESQDTAEKTTEKNTGERPSERNTYEP